MVEQQRVRRGDAAGAHLVPDFAAHDHRRRQRIVQLGDGVAQKYAALAFVGKAIAMAIHHDPGDGNDVHYGVRPKGAIGHRFGGQQMAVESAKLGQGGAGLGRHADAVAGARRRCP